MSNKEIIKKPSIISTKILKSVMIVAVPIALQNMLNFAVNMLDTVMLGSLGEVSMSAASLSNQLFFILTMIVFGITGGSNVLIAQYWGLKDSDAINRVLAYTYRVTLFVSVLMALIGICLPGQVLSIFTSDQAVIQEGISYLRILAFSYVFYALTTVTCGALRSVHIIRIAVLLSATSLVVNGFLNWVLIFGKLGVPSMGIKGAAIATVIARVVEFSLLALFIRYKEERLKIRLHKLLPLDRNLMKNYIQNTLPVICNELFWSVGASMLAIVMGRMGREVVAANSIYNISSQMCGVMIQGMNAAAAIMIGNTIGAKQYDQIPAINKCLRWISFFVGVLSAALTLGIRPFMLNLYNVTDLTKMYATQIMTAGAFIEMFRATQSMNNMGILRGGGDAKFVMINDLVFLWLLAVPLGFMAGLVWKWPLPVVYIILHCEQFFKLFTSTIRLKSDKWIKNVTVAANGS